MADNINAEVIGVYPNKVKISVDKLQDFKIAEEKLKVGSYLRIFDNDNAILIAIIESFSIEVTEKNKKYIIEANPLGIIKGDEFKRGGDDIAIPPKNVEPAKTEEIKAIYEKAVQDKDKLEFSTLSSNEKIRVPINGNKFFNKHIAIVGSTGSGKSHTVTKIIQTAISEKEGEYDGLNNSHVVIFDIHSEYKEAFPKAKVIGIGSLTLPYWLLNSEELELILLDTGDRDNYNQASIFRNIVTKNKKTHNKDVSKIFYDSPLKFDIDEVLNALTNFKNETRSTENPNEIQFKSGARIFADDDEKILHYFIDIYDFAPPQRASAAKGSVPAKVGISRGTYAEGTLDKFVTRFQAKINQDRLDFLFGENSKKISFVETVKKFIGYEDKNESNVTIIDLSGVPFEVLSITVSLISRVLFEFGYYYKRLRNKNDEKELVNNDTPLLLVYEEAHKYAPKSDLSRYRPSKTSIERIAKEGRKYGVTLLLASQRPSEISETIFSQCNNFISMRLTNPDDQNYVKRLLPDTLGGLIEKLPALQAGEGLLIGEAVVLPSIVKIDPCSNPPSSNDIPFWKLWKEKWKELEFDKIKDEWYS